VFFWASWKIKTSTVADEHSGYDPYHSNVPAAGLGLRWKLDFMVLKANYKIAKMKLLQNQNRIDILKKLSEIKNYKILFWILVLYARYKYQVYKHIVFIILKR